MKMKKLIYIITLILLFPNAVSFSQSREVKYEGLQFDLAKIPLYTGLQISGSRYEKSTKSNIIEQKVFVARNYTNYAVSTLSENSEYNSKHGNYLFSTIELFDSKNKSVWKIETNGKMAYHIYLSDDNSITLVRWAIPFDEIEEKAEIEIFDSKGVSLFKENDIREIKLPINNRIHIYFQKDYYYTNIDDYKYTLYYFNTETQETWHKTFTPGPGGKDMELKSVANNGYVICSANKIYLLNSKGNIIWSKDRDQYAGDIRLSDNGIYTSQVLRGRLSLFENNNGNELMHLNSINYENKEYKIYRAFFIGNEKDCFSILSVNKEEGMIFFFVDFQGTIKDKFVIDKLYKRDVEIIKQADGAYFFYIDGILERQYLL